MKKVLVALTAKSVALREFLMGVLSYVNSGHEWDIYFEHDPHTITPNALMAHLNNGIDGIVTGFTRVTPGYRAMLELDIPITLNNFPAELPPPNRKNIVVLHNDDIAIGRTAARLLRSKGSFRSYAYVTTGQSHWSVFRERGFRLELGKHRIIPFSMRRSKMKFGEWIVSLPKPAAIFAECDMVAAQVLSTCKAKRLHIPEQVAIIGVDNDEIICNTIRPTISSIHPNHVEISRRAATELDRLMHGKKISEPSPLFIPPIGVVERDSTRSVPPAGFLIREGLAYIRENATKGISAGDVARHLKISESLARLRFRTVHGCSIKETILETQLAEVKCRLVSSSDSLVQIAAKTGFSSACHLSHFFKKRCGISPHIWRNQQSLSH